MRTEDDRAARLQRDEDLVDRRRRRVGRRDNRGDDAEGLGDLDHSAVVVPCDDPDGLHRADEVVDLLRAEQVLLNLVFDDAVGGFLDGEARERLRLRRGGGGHRIDDRVDARLIELGELEPRLLRSAGERTCLGNRREIAIGLRGNGGLGHGGELAAGEDTEGSCRSSAVARLIL